jgi:IS1 family transposase
MRLYLRSIMFNGKNRQIWLDNAIDKAVRELNTHTVGSEEYMKTLNLVIKLNEIRYNNTSSVSKDTLAVVFANLFGIFMIIKHEHVNVIASKALNLLMKPR